MRKLEQNHDPVPEKVHFLGGEVDRPPTEHTNTAQNKAMCCYNHGTLSSQWCLCEQLLGSSSGTGFHSWKPPSISGIILMREAGESARDL